MRFSELNNEQQDLFMKKYYDNEKVREILTEFVVQDQQQLVLVKDSRSTELYQL